MISVIIPIYNVEPYLRECIDSIRNQTYQDLDIILINDGSQDKCGEICEDYAKKDTRIRVFHTGNKGLSAARNLGLREAVGEYIGFVDSDDWIEPDMYEILLRRIEETGTSISTCGVWTEFLKRKNVKKCGAPRKLDRLTRCKTALY
jgi:glycosyltransferase involved in cell wall biosynthesis